MPELFTLVANVLDESFAIQETKNYDLSVVFSETGFSCSILDYRRSKYLGIQQVKRNDQGSNPKYKGIKPGFEDFLKSAFAALPWLKNQYRSVHIAVETKKSTLIPAVLFDSQERQNYLNFNFTGGEEERILSDHLIPADIQHVYSIPEKIYTALKGHFPQVNPVSYASVIIASVWIHYKNRINNNRVFLHVGDHRFEILIFDGHRMSYFNTFPYQNREDIVYYLIFVMEQLNQNPENTPVIILGNIDKNNSLLELIYRYVRHVEFVRRNEAFKYSHTLNQFPPHFYYPLLNFQICGL